jgi:hypothetical protein
MRRISLKWNRNEKIKIKTTTTKKLNIITRAFHGDSDSLSSAMNVKVTVFSVSE